MISTSSLDIRTIPSMDDPEHCLNASFG